MDNKKNLMNNAQPFEKVALRELTLLQIEAVSGGDKDRQSASVKMECNSRRGCSGWLTYERKF